MRLDQCHHLEEELGGAVCSHLESRVLVVCVVGRVMCVGGGLERGREGSERLREGSEEGV